VLFLTLPLSKEIYHSILEDIHELVMPYVTEPTLFLDFFTESFNIGGETSILALQDLFLLITKHNLDYPDFYPKLYTLFDLNICQSKYRKKIF